MQKTKTFPFCFNFDSISSNFNLPYFVYVSFAAKQNKEGKLEICKPIHKVDLKTTKMG